MDFELISTYKPTGDQPDAIRQLVSNFNSGQQCSTLLGVTGSGKTFTMANVIAQLNRATLVLSHNKTLAAQLYSEFKNFFPKNAVEYFVSYYDYYQPEAYIPHTDTYIEKDLQINEEIEKLRLSASSALLSGRKDVIVVSSVSCLYGIGNPEDFNANTITVHVGQKLSRNKFLYSLVDALYSRSETDFKRSTFRVKGDTVDVYLAYGEYAYRIIFMGDEIEHLEIFSPVSGVTIDVPQSLNIFPANIFVTPKERLQQAIRDIQDDMLAQKDFFTVQGKNIEAKRIQQRVEYDLEMIKELGYCSGIENYSRYFDGRAAGSRPFCLLDYFPDDFITFIDESHVTIPQIRAMYGGDRSRKQNLVEYGFRLPAAIDNRPLKFEEFESIVGQMLFVSATPADYELNRSEGIVVEQVIRPTGLLEPVIEVRPTKNQIDNLIEEIAVRADKNERIFVTTLTKRMAEELSKYFDRLKIRCRYIHSDVSTLERIEIMDELQKGLFDVLIGVNLLREGLDVPEVSLVAILDADKEGFLRSTRSLTQTAGRAARNLEGKVIMYADKITDSMQRTIEETDRRREKQLQYNMKNNITPKQITKTSRSMLVNEILNNTEEYAYIEPEKGDIAAEPVVKYMSKKELDKAISEARKRMETAAKDLNFHNAAIYRDEMYSLMKLMATLKNS
ncbi:MAG: excinuclease ABC subunit UvrB [Prevotellaceae bacterium]|jgi:excinuclease ABC subunit B|nr:excinuclease ABC subunit UvrB [Prevotellaceae bacterium]